MRKKSIIIILLFIIAVTLVQCQKNGKDVSVVEVATNYREIPGITPEEIVAIESLQQNGPLVYASMQGKEGFIDEAGNIRGFSERLSELLGELFMIDIEHKFMSWEGIVNGLDDGTVALTTELSITPERKERYYMSEPISEHNLVYYQKKGIEDIYDKASERKLVFAFGAGSITEEVVRSVFWEEYESVYVYSIEEIIELIDSEKVDAYFMDDCDWAELSEIEILESFPLTPPGYRPLGITAKNEAFEALISAFDKYLLSGGNDIICDIYEAGRDDYNSFMFKKSLTLEEQKYLQELKQSEERIVVGSPVLFYPVSFYNDVDEEFQGISVDLLKEISKISELEFQIVNDNTASWKSIADAFDRQEVKMITGFEKNEERTSKYLFSEAYARSEYVLISLNSFHNIGLQQVMNIKVGAIEGTAAEEYFKTWFGDMNLKAYTTLDDVFEALDTGEIDAFVESEYALLSKNNFKQQSGYKLNISLEYPSEIYFGFNHGDEMLCSIIDKAQAYIDVKAINTRWTSNSFDYTSRMNEQKRQLLTVISCLLALCVILGIIIMINVSRSRNKMEKLVQERTGELSRQTKFLEGLYDTLPDAVFTKDMDGYYISCNDAIEQFLGITKEELIGSRDVQVLVSQEDFVSHLKEDDEEALEAGDFITQERTITRANGEVVDVEIRKQTIRENGVPIGYLSVCRDMTVLKRSEKAALAAAEAKSEFLAKMSHEIRTPLNAIVGLLHIIRQQIDDKEKVEDLVNKIGISSEHLVSIVNDILDMSKIEVVGVELSLERFALYEDIVETIQMLDGKVAEKDIEIVILADEAKDRNVNADKRRLNQVFVNLLSNAIKFSPNHSQVIFTTGVEEIDEKYILLKVSVEDKGIGMSKEQMDKLFVPFSQGDATISQRFGGTGLGLSISQRIMEAMDSTILVESELDKGSKFFFEVKLEIADQLDDTKSVCAEANLSGCNLLLVEDIAINREIITEFLKTTNINIVEAVDGKEAVQIFADSEPNYFNVIFMDIQMPNMNGYEATSRIRNLERADAKSVNICAMTADAYPEDVKKSMDAGMNYHMAKPINLSELLLYLSKLMQ